MNKSMLLTALVCATVLAAGCGRKNAETGTHFGEPFTDAPVVEIGELQKKADDFHRKTVRIAGTIDRQCPSSGCWLFLRGSDGSTIRVELSDYFPKLPQNVGNEAMVEGEVIKKGTTPEFVGTRVSFFEKGTGK